MEIIFRKISGGWENYVFDKTVEEMTGINDPFHGITCVFFHLL